MRITAIFLISFILVPGLLAANTKESTYKDAQDFLAEGRLDEAEAALNRRLSLDDRDVVALSSLGEVCRLKDDRKKALRLLDKAVLIDPKYPMTYLYRGKLYLSMQKLDEVAGEFSLYIENMRPLINSAEKIEFYIVSLHDISQICFALKKYDVLYGALSEILRLSPKDQAATYNLGVYYYVYDRNRPKAYSCFMKTIEIDPSTLSAAKARYAIEFMRANPDPRIEPDLDFIDREYRD